MTKTLSERLEVALQWYEAYGELPAADIESIMEGIALARRVEDSEWVACSERLPGPCDCVEVYPDTNEPQTHNFYAHFNGGTNGVKAGNWYYNDVTGYDNIIHPTHWRPINRDEPALVPVEGGA